MRNKLTLLFIVIAHISYSQTKKVDKPITINSLMYYLNNLKLEDADSYFLNIGYKFTGTTKHNDTIGYRYKRSDSYQSIALTVVDNKTFSVSFFTRSDKTALALVNSIKANGFKYLRTTNADNGMTDMSYYKDNYSVIYTKKYYPEDEQSAFYISLYRR